MQCFGGKERVRQQRCCAHEQELAGTAAAHKEGPDAELRLERQLAAAQAELKRKEATLKEKDAVVNETQLTRAQPRSAQELTEQGAGLKNEDTSSAEAVCAKTFLLRVRRSWC